MVQPVAGAVLDDPRRVFVSSVFVRLEVLPKAIYLRNWDEVAFYEAFFGAVVAWAEPSGALIDAALAEAMRSGLAAVDALHIAAAATPGAAELVTTERLGSPILRTTLVKVVSIHPSAGTGPRPGR